MLEGRRAVGASGAGRCGHLREIERTLRCAGFAYVRTANGGHALWQHPQTGQVILLPLRASRHHIKQLELRVHKELRAGVRRPCGQVVTGDAVKRWQQ